MIGVLIMLASLGLLVVGVAVYSIIKGDRAEDEIIYDIDDELHYDKYEEDYEKLTYDYFMDLTLEDQERYYKENLDLKYWKDDACKGLTNDRYLNAKHAAEIARVEGKKFVDKNKTY